MIAIVEKLDLPTVEGEDYRELRDTNSHCGDAVKELIQMLQYVDLLTLNSDVDKYITYTLVALPLIYKRLRPK